MQIAEATNGTPGVVTPPHVFSRLHIQELTQRQANQ